MKKLGVAIVVIATAAYAGVGQSQGKTDPTLDKLAKEFMTAFNAKDAAKVASFYAEDAVVMPPNHALVNLLGENPTVSGVIPDHAPVTAVFV